MRTMFKNYNMPIFGQKLNNTTIEVLKLSSLINLSVAGLIFEITK